MAALWLFAVTSALAQNYTPSPPTTPSIPGALSFTPDTIFGLLIGVMLTATLYLFFIWVVIRDRGQVFLLILLLCLSVNMVVTNDQIMTAMGLSSETVRTLLRTYSLLLAYFASIFFTYYSLEIELNAPGLRFLLFAVALVLLLLLVFTAFDAQTASFVLPTLGTLALGAVLAAGVRTLQLRISGSLTHIIAFLFFLLGGIAGPLDDLDYIGGMTYGENLTYGAYALAALVFAIVIAGQFASRQEEKERQLAISNERFALAVRGSNEGLFDWNVKTGEVYFSDQFRRILGKPLEAGAYGLRTWLKQIRPQDRLTILKALRHLRHNPRAATIYFEYRVAEAKTGWRWLHTKVLATRDPMDGSIARYVGSIGDISARKRGEAALRASEARFRSITEAHPVPVLIARLQDKQIVYASPGAETLLGLPHGTVTSHTINRFLTRADERNAILDRMRNGEEVNLMEVVVARGDSEMMPVALSARRIKYQDEAAMVIGLYDLTERKRAEEQIAQQQEALQQSEKMAALGGLLAGVAHELNNPLSVVVGQATLLEEGSSEPKTRARAEKIYKAADRCSRIVKSFLALARRKPPERKALDLNGVINASLDLLSYQFRNANVDLTLDLASDLPSVKGDNDQLTQVFTNLALNATQAMQNWKGPHRLTIRSHIQGPGEILVAVSDTGPGIPPEIRTRIFEPFFTTKSGQGGTGVGLSLCINIIETHGGRIQFEETQGGGATFLITLPSSTATFERGQDEANSVHPVLPSNLNVLLVDDEIELAQTLADLLEPLGHRTALAANGALAIEKLRKDHYDIIVSDLRMPVMDGPSLYAELQRSFPDYTKRIIYVTGDTMSPHVQSFLKETPVPLVEKPYRLADVEAAIAERLKDVAQKGSMS